MSSDTNISPVHIPPAPPGFTELDGALGSLREGYVVAIPTDTLYGLSADVGNVSALERVFEIKGRPGDLALPVLAGSWDQVSMVAIADTPGIRRLASTFWPGSLTMVLPKHPSLSALITGGRETVAVRIPSHWVPLNLAARLGRPITGTSANRSGRANLVSPGEIREVLGSSLAEIVELGPAPGGFQSTIVDMTGITPELLREGATPFKEVLRAWQQGNLASLGKTTEVT